MPVGAFGGKKEIMAHISPLGPVYQAGTLSGNPVAMASGLATLDIISEPGLTTTTYSAIPLNCVKACKRLPTRQEYRLQQTT